MGSPISQGERIRGSLVGLAVGDALGWPQEQNSKNVDRSVPTPELKFRRWRRRAGGRFQSFDEEIGSGEYSDDTQLTLCVSRSLLHGDAWYEHLTRVELPTWTTYQRGGGRSVLRAAHSWMSGTPPWDRQKLDPTEYFATGANGVAMRVLPHVLRGLREDDLVAVCRRIALDGCATHGHAAALVGALMHASTLWNALRLEGTLGYGELLDRLAADSGGWSDITVVEFPNGWMASRQQSRGMSFEEEWARSVDEAWRLLGVAQEAMQSGPLAADEETLGHLGVFDRKVNGSGLVSAVAALFIASRAASNPELGLLDSAFLRSADSDTVASMTASILGSVAGTEWMNGLQRAVQDHGHLQRTADLLTGAGHERGRVTSPPSRVIKSGLDRWSKSLADVHPDSPTQLPDGRTARLHAVDHLTTKSPKASTVRYVLQVDDGQTIFLVKHSRVATPSEQPLGYRITHVGVRVRVSSLAAARRFYEEILGLSPSRTGDTFARYGDTFALEVAPNGFAPSLRLSTPGFVVQLETKDVLDLHRALASAGAEVEPLREEKGRSRFTCRDPDGNLIEVVAPVKPD